MVPKGWKLSTVGELFDVQLGKMLNKEAKEQHPQFPYFGNSDVRWGFLDKSELKTMYFSEKERTKFTLTKGDILLCEGGEVGRCAIWQLSESNIYYQKALHRLRTKGHIVPEYFQSFMLFINGTKLLEDYTTKTSIAHLTREKLVELPVKTPPLPEQRKIAKILSTWDQAIATTECLIATSQQQKKALMQQLLTGKKRLVNPETGKVFEGDWEKMKISQLGSIVSGGTPSTETPSYWNGNIHWVTPTDITKLSTRKIDKTARTITEDGLKNSSAKLVPKGSLLVCTRATIGEMAISEHEMCTNQGFKNLIPNKKANVDFIYYLMCFSKHKLVSKASGSTFLELSKKDFEQLRFKVPEVKEQQKIASVLTAADQEIELLEAKLAHLKDEKKALMQQLLTGKRRVKVDAAEVA